MKIFVAGGTGFVGQNVVKHLTERGYETALLVRSSASLKGLESLSLKVIPVYGTIQDKASLSKAMSGCDAVINLVGIIKESGENTFEKVHYEGAVNLMGAAGSLGISRFIHMSAEGTRENASSRYHQTKFKTEEHLRASGLVYTIFRPSMMFGPADRNFNLLADMIKKAPVIPVIGDGNYKWQPVSVKNVAELFVSSIESRKAENKTYEVRGPETFTFNEILDLLMKILGVRKAKVHIPAFMMKAVMSPFDGLLPLPITADQLKMLLDDYNLPESNFQGDFSIKLIHLEEGLREYIGREKA
jgi:uncharacterized protein YbjT (DUF2867 family)